MQFVILQTFVLTFSLITNVVFADDSRRISDYMRDQNTHALDRVLQSFVGSGVILGQMERDERGLSGAIIAAPSRVLDLGRGEVQDYEWRWKRDSAIIMRFMVRAMRDGDLRLLSRQQKLQLLQKYVEFCELEQNVHFINGVYELGHAKVTLLGERNPHAWGYPQNDGPALEISVLSDIWKLWQDLRGDEPHFKHRLQTVWHRNLDYILKNYDQPSVERWEETKAELHFSILAEMYYALDLSHQQKGLSLRVAPHEIRHKMTKIEEWISSLIARDAQYPFILSHKNIINEGSLVRNKSSGLDTQVLMTSLYINKFSQLDSIHRTTPLVAAEQNSHGFFYSPSHPLMRQTYYRLYRAFQQKYPVNTSGFEPSEHKNLPGIVFGRYPEDQGHFGGAPWFITSFAAIQYLLWDAIYIGKVGLSVTAGDRDYFNLSSDSEGAPPIGRWGPESDVAKRVSRNLVRLAKDMLYRSVVHTGEADLTLTEVLNGDSGYKEGIQNLTWSYVEYLKTSRMLRRAQDFLKQDFNIQIPQYICVQWLLPDNA